MANPTDADVFGAVARLREEHPDWFFATVWCAAEDGDRRMLIGQRRGVVLADFTYSALSAKIAREDGPEPGGTCPQGES